MIDTILWDNDGILVDTEGLYFQATREIMATADYTLTEQEYIEYFLLQGNGSWHLLTDDSDEVSRLRKLRNDRYSELIRDGVRVYDGVESTLKSLHGNYRMGIVTSCRRDHFEMIHARAGLLDYFDFVITSADVSETKPHPELYLKGLERAGSTPDTTIAVEDSARGLIAANAAGIPCYVITTEWTASSDFTVAAGVLDLVSRLPEILTSNVTPKP